MEFDRVAEERAALEAAPDGLIFECDAGIVSLANMLLGTMAGFATLYPEWRYTLGLLLGPEAAQEAAAQVEAARERFHLEDPIGAVPHGMRFMGEIYVEERHVRRLLAVRVLAATGRLVAAQRGDDRCIVVLTAEHLSAAALGVPNHPLTLDG